MDTSDLVSDADFLPNAPMPGKPSGKGAPELLSDMSGVLQGLHSTYLDNTVFCKSLLRKREHIWCMSYMMLKHGWFCACQGSSTVLSAPRATHQVLAR